ncbi:MAG: cytochrome d ubiquinol oxidase subunit II [Bacteroidales bacterium]|nr:cytochrome d ubiquinol oxidase subunit II [Bacteroidales bacterium]
MFETLSHTALQEYWWGIMSLLGGVLVFLLFVQGGQTLIYTLGKTETERTILVNSLGRKWEFTFTTLVTFGGAFFASFPLFYATSFGGAYWIWISILLCFIIQAIAYEYRSKPNNIFGSGTYENFLFINGACGTFMLGVVVATFFTGSKFSIDFNHISGGTDVAITRWETNSHGLESLLNVHNLALGLAVFFLARILAILYFMNNVAEDNILMRARKYLIFNAIPFLIFFLFFMVWLFLIKGFALDPVSGEISLEPYKYFHNLIGMPFIAVIFLTGVGLVLFGIIKSVRKVSANGIWFAGPGTVVVVFSLFAIAGFNNTAYYPSSFDLQSSLTIYNSSSSHYTLTAMSYVSLLVPVVFAYIFIAWKSINKKRIDAGEVNSESHVY